MIYMSSMVSATIFAIVWGFSTGLGQVSYMFIMPHFYGTECVATLNSMFASATIFGSAIGPIAYGVAIDKIGSWPTILWWTVPVAMVCTITLLLTQKPVLEREQESKYVRLAQEEETEQCELSN